MRIRSILPALSLLTLLLLGGCGGDDRKFQAEAQGTPERVAGKYVYHWKSGEVEVLLLDQAGGYQHFMYPAGPNPEAQPPLHASSGRWLTNYGGPWVPNEIHLSPYDQLYGDQAMDHPTLPGAHYRTLKMYWNSDGPKIQYTLESTYIFERPIK